MDRLQTVVALTVAAALALAAGCKSEGGGKPAPSRQRVNAVAANQPSGADVEGMCDRSNSPGSAPALSWPELADGEPPAGTGRWQWINVWATWCEPCVEELPRLASWQPRLAKDGVAFDLVLVSADEDAATVDEFRKQHQGTPPTRRLAEPDAIATWIESLGVKGASLPVHIFVDPAGKVRCVRASAIEDSDYSAVKALLGG
jgi:thiol-disulfide isomerase/thioredoxin